jgi:hypothetical protein
MVKVKYDVSPPGRSLWPGFFIGVKHRPDPFERNRRNPRWKPKPENCAYHAVRLRVKADGNYVTVAGINLPGSRLDGWQTCGPGVVLAAV